jgi:predicted N-acetyltransferase YhbS
MRSAYRGAHEGAHMITIREETPRDAVAREALLDRVYPIRFTKTSERLRAGRLPAEGLSFVATERGRIVGTVRLWNIATGAGRAALLLGPLAVAAHSRNRGIGAALVRHARQEAERRGHAAVLLVGDAPYYGRFGFSADKTGALRLPGPYEQHRLLACELLPGTLDGAHGLIRATGAKAPMPERVAPAAPADKSNRRARAA